MTIIIMGYQAGATFPVKPGMPPTKNMTRPKTSSPPPQSEEIACRPEKLQAQLIANE
jgi:hypothetical protein